MGLLRLLLAIAVLIDHSGPLFGLHSVGGDTAVEAFFMISGFYMALILNTKYNKGDYWLFITNRLLRLFPIYWLLVLLTLVASIATYFTFGHSLKLAAYQQAAQLSVGTWLLILLANIFIVGQDFMMFLGLDRNGGLHFTNHALQGSQGLPPLYQFLFVHQAWSLALEISFYLLAPFLVRRKPAVLLVLCTSSLLLRFYLYQLGLYHGSWNYRFFPSELVFFLTG
ncbi:MAG: acyltransferase family protein, partial [Janthinobacterium lividum]